MYTIVGIGACVADTLIDLDAFPTEDAKVYADGIKQAGGGPCATALVTAAVQGSRCAYIGNLANDPPGQFMLNDFKKYGVGTDYINISHGAQSFVGAVILNRSAATRTCILHRGSLPKLCPDERMISAVRSAKLLVLDGCHLEAAVQAAKAARNAGVDVLYDAGGLYNGIEQLLPFVNILIPSEDFALSYTGETCVPAAAQRLADEFHPDVTVITQGKNGGWCMDANGGRSYPSFEVDAVDSNGAGDVFHGAFAYGVTQGWPYYDCCVFSSAAAALKCTGVGARESVPSRGEILNVLCARGYNRFSPKEDV